MNLTYLLLGSNLGDRFAILKQAREEISKAIGKISGESSVYESEPWGFQSDYRFLNQVLKVETELKPFDVLNGILNIENKLGRTRTGNSKYISRLIDIDILFYNDEIISEMTLTIPHPKISERKFTLVPLNEIAPTLLHPATGKSISDLIKECSDSSGVFLYRPK